MRVLPAIVIAWLAPLLYAQNCTPNWTPTFGEKSGADALLRCMAVVDVPGPLPRMLFVGGGFNQVGAVLTQSLGAWNGERWLNPTPGLTGQIAQLIEHDDGSGRTLFAAGVLQIATSAGTLNRTVARWDGQAWAPVGSEFYNLALVYDLAVVDLGAGPELVMGGNGVLLGVNVARWNGSAWSSMDFPFGTVSALRTFDDGSGVALYAATRTGATSRVARWSGGAWVQLGGMLNGDVNALEVFDYGAGPSLYAGGRFTHAGATFAPGVTRWDGQTWKSVAGGVGASVSSLKSLDDGTGPKLFVSGGGFSPAPFHGIASFNGQAWSPLPGANGQVAALEAYAGRLFAIGPQFSQPIAGLLDGGIVAWNGAQFSVLGEGLSSIVRAMASFDDTGSGAPALFVGGLQDLFIAGRRFGGVARWNGAQWSELDGGVAGGSGQVTAMQVFDDGFGAGPQLYVGGNFASAGGIASNRVARWGPNGWSSAGMGAVDGTVLDFEVFNDGNGPALYAGGNMQVLGGSQRALARWNGTSWTWISGFTFPNSVEALCAFDDGAGSRLYVGGSFQTAGGVPGTANIARWIGGVWKPLGTGMNNPVLSMHAFNDGSGAALYAGGSFTAAGGIPASRVARWNGLQWSPVGAGFSANVWSLATAPLGPNGSAQLFAGGIFDFSGAASMRGVARWNGANWESLGATEAGVYSVLAHDDGTGGGLGLFLGGQFRTSPGRDSYLAKWGCDADAVVTYCTAMTSASGCVATLSATGAARLSLATPFVLTATDVDGARSGSFFYGASGRNTSPFGAGVLCVRQPIRRLGIAASGGTAGACDGVLTRDWSAFVAGDALALGQPFFAGQRLQAQGWIRDPLQQGGVALTGGLEFEMQP
jgi:hypothetical protein